ncbi:MAG: sensor domain-containing diguanylate cyclase [Nitrospirae bacterium]|nr:sensor domain-containing diguanylate cyclase [Nitrospirota bacterium]
MRKFPSIDFFNEITNILTSVSDLNKGLTALMKEAKAATKSEAWSLLIDEDFCKKIPLRSSGNIRKFKFKYGVGIAGWTLAKGVPMVVRSAAKDKRYNSRVDGAPGLKIKSLMCAPLRVNDRTVGVLRLINKKSGEPFADEDLKLLANLSCCAGLAVERAFLYRRIEEISITDDLTGLYNFRFMNHSIEMEIERSRRYGALFSVIFMDIDNLKKVNEKFGHLTGSKVLIETAGVLKENLRKVDIAIKYGGDEFVIILPQTSREGGFLVAERLRKMIEKNVFLKKEGCPLRITASFGVASFPDNAKSKEELLELADKAMFRGKLSTKNVVFAAK